MPSTARGSTAIASTLGLPPGGQRRFAFERLPLFKRDEWQAMKGEAEAAARPAPAAPRIFGSDVSHRMVDFAQRNAERAGVAQAVQLRGGDALQRQPPCAGPGLILMNPPYGERIAVAGKAGAGKETGWKTGQGRETFQTATLRRGDENGASQESAHDFFEQLSQHWKTHFGGWTAWLLTPDARLSARLRLKESRRVPLFNGPIECRLLRFELTARRPASAPGPAA